MKEYNPYRIVKRRHVTEKATVLQGLKDATANRSLARCESPKYVFIVEPRASKQEIAKAIEKIYSEKSVKVVAVNTINVKPKPRRVRGRKGKTSGFKKAVVTLEKGDLLDEA